MPTGTQSALLSLALMVFASAMFATATGLTKLAASAGAPMLWYLVFVMSSSGILIMLFALATGANRGLLRKDAIRFGTISGVLMLVYNAINFVAVAHVGASFVSLAFVLPALLTYAFAVMLGMDRLNLFKICAVASGIAGGVILARAKFSLMTGAEAGWIILAISNPILMAINNIYRTRYWPDGMHPLLAAGLMLLMGGLAGVPIAAGLDSGPELILAPGILFNMLIVAAVFTVQYPAFLAVQYLSGPVFLSLSGPMIGVFGTSGAVLLLGESAPPGLLAAAGLMIGGVLLFQVATRRETRSQAP